MRHIMTVPKTAIREREETERQTGKRVADKRRVISKTKSRAVS
jgi:hypothetical protein